MLGKLLQPHALPPLRRNEGVAGQLNDYRSIATRYDKPATNLTSNVCLAAVCSWQ
ncbi:hypothetical protein [Lichenicoccus roseus]|uniref:hypothetical protein n=1 Tax=Lichenicoccus roseus TaxID=2683649 RepID=UPI0014873996|nr:hypothetical protein [Lichenicoccus roseus]